jgi:hypothetical protein
MRRWIERAEALFGRNWVSPLSEITADNLRSVRHWRAAGRCPEHIDKWLADTTERLPAGLLRAYGACLQGAIHCSETIGGAAEALRTAHEDITTGRLPRRDNVGAPEASPRDLAKYLPRSRET